MKNKFLILIIILILSLQVLNGCIEEETRYIEIVGKGYFDSIQKAIDAASNNDKILVYKGIYHETLKVNKSISLVSVNKNDAILSYPEYYTTLPIIKIDADNCTIDGFKLIGFKNLSQLSAIEITSSNNTIFNNFIQESYYGIFQRYSNNNMISNNTIIDNEFGIYMLNSMNNQIISNNIKKNSVYGVFMSLQSDHNLFKYNQISQNNIGLRIYDSQNNKYENNLVQNNNEKGFYICCEAKNNIVFNNSIINNNPNADGNNQNQWYYNKVGNYWSDYKEKYPNAKDENNDGFWDTPYLVSEYARDLFPLVKSILIL